MSMTSFAPSISTLNRHFPALGMPPGMSPSAAPFSISSPVSGNMPAPAIPTPQIPALSFPMDTLSISAQGKPNTEPGNLFASQTLAPMPVAENSNPFNPTANPFATAGNINPTDSANLPAPQLTQLVNGGKAHLIQNPQWKRSVVEFQLPVPRQIFDVSNLWTSMLSSGSPQTRAMIDALKNEDISVGFGFNQDKLVLQVAGPAEKEPQMLQAGLFLFRNPQVNPADFERERTQLMQVIQGTYSSPEMPLAVASDQNLYGPGQAYSQTPSEIIRLLQTQTPQALATLHQQTLNNTQGLTVAMFSPKPAVQQAQLLNQSIQQAGWMPNPFRPAQPIPGISSAINPAGVRPFLLVPSENAKRAFVECNWKAPTAADPDYFPYRLLCTVLDGQGENSYFKKLRTEDGLVYGVNDGPGGKLGDGRQFQASIEVDYDKIKQGIADLQSVGQKIAQQTAPFAVTEDQLNTAKRKLLLSMRNRQQTSYTQMSFATPWLNENLQPPTMNQIQAALAKVTPQDIQRIATRMFNNPQGLNNISVSAPTAVLQQTFPGSPLTTPAL